MERPKPDDYVKVSFDGIKLRDAETLDAIGRRLFTKEDGTYNPKDLFYFLHFQLRGINDELDGVKRSILRELKAEVIAQVKAELEARGKAT